MTNFFTQYLKNYAEPEVKAFEAIPNFNFDYSLCVPLHDEEKTLPILVESSIKSAEVNQKTILHIFVLNHRVSSEENVKTSNRNVLKMWKNILSKNSGFFESKNIFFGFFKKQPFLFVDRVTNGFEFKEKEGVGLARKISCDLACFFIEKGFSKSSHIFSTDGDAKLPENFYKLPKLLSKCYFMTSNFTHSKDLENKNQIEAIIQYENYMKSYVEGLKFAGSAYAFYTIGSCLSFSAEAYVKVRGFPKGRLAGEDFYLINKLSKCAQHVEHISDPLLLSSRLSTRVPFGTGQSLKKILKQETLCYVPYKIEDFYLLKTYLETAKKILLNNESVIWSFFDENPFYLNLIENAKKMSKTPTQRLKHFSTSFDSFQTLRFVNFLKNKT